MSAGPYVHYVPRARPGCPRRNARGARRAKGKGVALGGGPSDYSLTLSALTALAVKQGELPALLKAVRLLLFGSSFYIPPPPPATYSAPPPSSTLSDAQPNMR